MAEHEEDRPAGAGPEDASASAASTTPRRARSVWADLIAPGPDDGEPEGAEPERGPGPERAAKVRGPSLPGDGSGLPGDGPGPGLPVDGPGPLWAGDDPGPEDGAAPWPASGLPPSFGGRDEREDRRREQNSQRDERAGRREGRDSEHDEPPGGRDERERQRARLQTPPSEPEGRPGERAEGPAPTAAAAQRPDPVYRLTAPLAPGKGPVPGESPLEAEDRSGPGAAPDGPEPGMPHTQPPFRPPAGAPEAPVMAPGMPPGIQGLPAGRHVTSPATYPVEPGDRVPPPGHGRAAPAEPGQALGRLGGNLVPRAPGRPDVYGVPGSRGDAAPYGSLWGYGARGLQGPPEEYDSAVAFDQEAEVTEADPLLALPALPETAVPARRQAESADSLTSDFLMPGRPAPPRGGWRRVLFQASGGLVRVPRSAAERRREELIMRACTPVANGHHRVAVLSLKGGVGKTTTTMGLGATLASLRGDRVIAVDANPDRGTLSDKLRLETAATVRDLLNERHQIERYADVRAYTTQAPSRLEVLASDRDPAVSVAFSDEDYEDVARVLEHYYSVCVTDCGTGLLHSAMAGVLRLADQIVVVSSPSVDGARSASATLDWLAAHNYGDLVRGAVVVLSAVRPGSKSTVDLGRLEQHFAARCRAVVRIPNDVHLEEGAELDLDQLSKATADAYLVLAAEVGDGFAWPRR